MFSKSLNYYKSLDYSINIQSKEMDGEKWYVAYCNEFGVNACHGIGSTTQEALGSFLHEKDAFIEFLFAKGEFIPEPTQVETSNSGVFSVRTSPWLHSTLICQAKENGVSLNQYINQLLSFGAGRTFEASKVETKIDALRMDWAHQSKAIISHLNFVNYNSIDIAQPSTPAIIMSNNKRNTPNREYEQFS